MAENLLYHAHGNTLNEQECCAGVSRIVEPLSRQTSRLQSALVAAGYRRGVQRRPDRTREDEVTILPGWPCGDSFLKLARRLGLSAVPVIWLDLLDSVHPVYGVEGRCEGL